MLTLQGTIVACNTSAASLWNLTPEQLADEAFVQLFAFDIVSDDADWLEVQWQTLRDAALAQPQQLRARLHDGALRDVTVRIEIAHGLADRLWATILSTAKTENVNSDNGATALLTGQGGLAFFDLNPLSGQADYSPAWLRVLGYAPGEIAPHYATWTSLLHPEDSAAAPDQIGRRATPGVHPFNAEFRIKHQRGHFVWIHGLGVRLVNDAGTVDRVSGLIIDISERKELEETSLANDDRLTELSAGGPLGVFELDFINQRFWYSAAWGELLGLATLAPTADTFRHILPLEMSEVALADWWLSRQPGQSLWTEVVPLRRGDGSLMPFLIGARRQLTRRHELARITGFLCKLPTNLGTPPREDVLAAVAEDTLEALAEAVMHCDIHGKVTRLNHAAARILRLTPAQAVGRPAGELLRLIDRQTGQPSEDVVERALAAEGNLPLCNEHALDRGDGEAPVPIVWTAHVSFSTDGPARAVIVIFRDPNEMGLTPEELLKSNRFESLGLLAGGIAHDFNNLLSTILGGISLAKDNRDYSALADSEKACLTAKGLTKQLLAAAKGGTGAMSVVATSEIIHDSVKIASAGSDAKIEVDVPEETWPVLVDRSQILQVFQNLIVNAIQAMPPAPHRGLVRITTRNRELTEAEFPSLAAGRYITINVTDNAAGIDPENLEKIFDPFFTTKKHGTGLGLATVLSIVRKHGGEIGVASTLGTGTTFTVFLPQAEHPVEVQARRAPTLRFGTGRVLFMDDDPKICALTATMLQSLDYKYDIAHHGEEAIKFYQRYLNIGRPYDAVIMDITVIGGMGGEECFQHLRQLDPDVRAIVSSGYDNEDMARRFLDMGFCGYLTKPYRVTDLGKVIKAVLG